MFRFTWEVPDAHLTDPRHETAIIRALRRACTRKGCGAPRGRWCKTTGGYPTIHHNRKDPQDR